MGKKNKKDKKKKGKGMQKTMAKLAKKELRRANKKGGKGKGERNDDDSEDIDAILREIALEQKKKTEVKITPHAPPSPRVHGTLTVHPIHPEKLIMFGGEFYDGKTDRTYGDLFVFNTNNQKWSQITSPNSPLPRLAHQAAAVTVRGGELWIFGGHFNSPKQGFRHQNELWVLHLKDMAWERVDAKGAPSPRSGHRMVSNKGQLFVFGGYYDSQKTCLYYNDLYVFDTNKREWTEHKVPPRAGPATWPSERSGFNMAVWDQSDPLATSAPVADPSGAVILVYGGMRVENKGKYSDVGITESDLWSLTLDGAPTWRRVEAPGGLLKTKRLGMGMVVHRGQLVFFGGVEDVETRWDLKSTHFADLWYYNLTSRKTDRIRLKSDMDQPQPPYAPSITKVEVGYQRATVHFTPADGRGLQVLSYTAVARPTGEKVHGSGSPLTFHGLVNGQKYTFFVSATNGAGKGAQSEASEQVSPTALRETSLAPVKEKKTDKIIAEKIVDNETEENADRKYNKVASGDAAKYSVKAWGAEGKVLAPTPRQASMVCFSGGGGKKKMFVFGGAFESKAREYMFNDLYSLDLDRREKWEVIHPINTTDQVWYGSDEDDDEDEDEDEDEDDGIDDAPKDAPKSGETLKDFFARTKDLWVERARKQIREDINPKALKKLAFQLASSACETKE